MSSDAKILTWYYICTSAVKRSIHVMMDFDGFVTPTDQETGNILHHMFFRFNESYNARSTAHSTNF
jgi:hypothetical protein